MNGRLYNNIGICSLGIAFVLQHIKSLALSKALLIMPFITNAELLKYLAHKNINTPSLEQLIAKKQKCFSNFNQRYYDGLTVSLNSFQLLAEIGLLELVHGEIFIKEKFEYDKSMGKRAGKIFDASARIANLVKADAVNLYTNLRIQL